MAVRPAKPETDPLYTAGGATDVELAAAVATLNAALALKQNAADAATDAELAALDAQVDAAVAGLEASIEALPDESEVAAAIAAAVAVHAADDASDQDLADAVADLTALIGAKQDAATAATDAEVAAALAGRFPIFNIAAYGAVGDGAADDTDALNDALQAAYDAGGGTVFCPDRHLIAGDVVIPHNGDSPPKQPTIRLTGNGGWASGQGGNPVPILSRGVLDLRGTGGAGKIDTRGLGLLQIENLTLRDEGDTGHPFLYTTNTTIRPSNVAFCGYSGKSGTSCNQDAIVLGGTGTVHDDTADAPFQGYGTVIDKCYVNRIRRLVYGRTYANDVVIGNGNFVGHQCGSNLAGGAAIEFLGLPASPCSGNKIVSNGIEEVAYVYGVKFENAIHNTVAFNGFYDPGAGTVAHVRFEAGAIYNTIIEGYGNDSKPVMSEATAGKNTLLTSHQSQQSKFPQGIDVIDLLKAVAGGKEIIIQPGTTTLSTAKVLRILRSAAESSNPGLTLLELIYDGTLTLGGAAAKKLSLRDGGGTEIAALSNFGKKWEAVGAGGTMEQNSGSGGSYLDMKNFGVRFYNHSNVLQVTIGDGGETIKFGASKDAQLERKAAKVIGLPDDHAFRGGRGATGARPSASTVGDGAQFYDQTLDKPIWSDGTNWRDAAGTVV